MDRTQLLGSDDDPYWYKDALIYELHVRAFADSDGDGVGDFAGLTDKLDYLQDLGVTALWLLPFYPSPLRDDGYDIADYNSIHTDYGNMRQFKRFLNEAHKRGLRVIAELVINHTSDQHPWFQRAVRAPKGSRYRDWYVWSDTSQRYEGTRIIFTDFESSNWTWHPQAQQFYWHRFYSHQPDLNFENPEVVHAVEQVLDDWFEMGVDGMRLDAIPYLLEREGTNCENLPETHDALKALRRHLDENHSNRMFLAEANQWPEDAAAYFGDGDECHMNFHFPLMPRLFMAVRMEDRYPIIDILQQTPEIPENCQWAIFLRNHDELTLEMVTDEERDYMYRAYAHDARMRINLGIRRRLAPLLGNNRRLVELLNGLLFAMPGTPVLYYGDEIGMGDNIYLGDRNGVRTPMQWSADRNAGFSKANPQKLYLPVIIDPEYNYETVNVEAQQNNPSSLLWWMKRLIALRRRHQVFGRGTITFLYPDNAKVLAFIREYGDERVLVVANLSRFVQAVELDLSAFRGLTPVEMFGRTPFPPIGDLPYFLTLGPHAFYWFTIEPAREDLRLTLTARAPAPAGPDPEVPVVTVPGDDWEAVFTGRGQRSLEQALPGILQTRRWFGGKARSLQTIQVTETVPFPRGTGRGRAHLVVLKVSYRDGEPDTYALPLTFVSGDVAAQLAADAPQALVAYVRGSKGDLGALCDALWEPHFGATLLDGVVRRRRWNGTAGEITTTAAKGLRGVVGETDRPPATVMRAEQSNTSIVFGDRAILKLFRRMESGQNPDLEVGRFLTERADFAHTPDVLGAVEYRRGRGEPLTLAILQRFVPNEGDAWSYTLDALGRYYEAALTSSATPRDPLGPGVSMFDLVKQEPPELMDEMAGTYLQSVELLGQRTAELHLALASDLEDPAFAPEPFTTLYQRSLYQSMRNLTRKSFQLLRRQLGALDEPERLHAERLIERESDVIERFRALTANRIDANRIRIHGDYHLGQVLYTGNDFVIIDFEGEPLRALGERRLKRSSLRDVAGMIRSFHYAAYAGLFDLVATGLVGHGEHLRQMEVWARTWYAWTSATFLRHYLATAAGADFIPSDDAQSKLLLESLLLEKSIYELNYELNNRPTWLHIPLQGALQLVEAPL